MVMVTVIGVTRSHVIIGSTQDLQLTLVEVSSPPPCHYLQGKMGVGAHVAPALCCHHWGYMGVEAHTTPTTRPQSFSRQCSTIVKLHVPQWTLPLLVPALG